MNLTLQQMAELVAFKGRLKDADEMALLGIERALVEIIFVAKSELVATINPAGYTREHLQSFVDAEHALGAIETRDRLHGFLIRVHGEVPPLDKTWPPSGSELERTLAFRQTDKYVELRETAINRARRHHAATRS